MRLFHCTRSNFEALMMTILLREVSLAAGAIRFSGDISARHASVGQVFRKVCLNSPAPIDAAAFLGLPDITVGEGYADRSGTPGVMRSWPSRSRTHFRVRRRALHTISPTSAFADDAPRSRFRQAYRRIINELAISSAPRRRYARPCDRCHLRSLSFSRKAHAMHR